MTTRKKADRAASEKGSGGGQISNASGTGTGPGSSSESAKQKTNERNIAGAGSDKTLRNRPGHKTHR